MANPQSQFQPGMSVPEFLGCFGTEARQCARAARSARRPKGFGCPRCAVGEPDVLATPGLDTKRALRPILAIWSYSVQ